MTGTLGSASADAQGYGLSAAYSFGGGLSAHIGYGWSEITAVCGRRLRSCPALGSSSNWSFGLNMSF
jgi:outer membrane protein OmpU